MQGAEVAEAVLILASLVSKILSVRQLLAVLSIPRTPVIIAAGECPGTRVAETVPDLLCSSGNSFAEPDIERFIRLTTHDPMISGGLSLFSHDP